MSLIDNFLISVVIENYGYKVASFSKYDLKKINFPNANDKIVIITSLENIPIIKIFNWNELKNYESDSCNIDIIIFDENIKNNELFILIKNYLIQTIFSVLSTLDEDCRLKNKEYEEYLQIHEFNNFDELEKKINNIDNIQNKFIILLKKLFKNFILDEKIDLTKYIIFDLNNCEIKNL